MNRIYFSPLAACIVIGLSAASLLADSKSNVMDVTATTSSTSPVVTLNWTTTATTPKIYRRVKGSSSWALLTTLSTGVRTYADSTALSGVAYEYSIVTSSPYMGGAIVAGHNIPLVESRGKVVLLIDNTMTVSLSAEITQLQRNLVADGWIVYRHDVPRETVAPNSNSSTVWAARTAELSTIRSIVKADYDSDTSANWALMILGRVPVPYSGRQYPDGHGEHRGAWPTDTYYADVNGTWTDGSIDTGTSGLSDARNYNLVGDGKFDQTVPPSNIEFECGRVDLSNMGGVPVGMSEVELLRQYLYRDNNFRKVQGNYVNVARRAIVDDNFGAYGETAWIGGYGSFGRNSGQMDNADWFATLGAKSMLFAYGCGGGTFTSASGVGTSTDFSKNDSRAVFTQLFGSWFGDWDSTNCFMRGPLAGTNNSLGLTCQWSGSYATAMPLYHMALGDTVGYCMKRSMNSFALTSGDWKTGSTSAIYIGLMGDPTLRLHSIIPPKNVVATSAAGGITLKWSASTDTTLSGYHVYRSTSSNGPFIRVSGVTAVATDPTGSCLGTGTLTYTDTASSLIAGTTYHYLVKALRMESTPSGTYANQSIGEYASVMHLTASPVPAAPTMLTVTRSSATACLLAWNDSSTDESGFLIERYDPATGLWEQVASLAANTTSYTDSTAPGGRMVSYRVRASSTNGYSDYSNIAGDSNLPGIVYEPSYSYMVDRTWPYYCTQPTRYNGVVGAVGVDYSTRAILGTSGVDVPATTGRVSWSHGEKESRAAIIPMPVITGPQTTKIIQVNYTNPSNGLGLGQPRSPYVYFYDPSARTLPSGWQSTTSGTIVSGGEGYAEHVNGVYGLAVQSGPMTSWKTSDSCRFLYRQVTGDFTFSARVTYFPSDEFSSYALAGLVVRGDLSGGAVMDGLITFFGNAVRATRLASGTTFSQSAAYYFGLSKPWFRMVRSGNTFTASCSRDEGVTWSVMGSATTLSNMPPTAYIGFVASSYNGSDGPMVYAQFDNVTVETPASLSVGDISTITAVPGTVVGEIAVSWSAATNATFYRLERSTSPGSGFSTIATVTAPTISYTDADPALIVNTTYYYRVYPFNAGYNGTYSAVVSSQPYLPSGIDGWRYLNFGTTEQDEWTGDLAVLTPDGVSNLMRYFLGLSVFDNDWNFLNVNPTDLPVIRKETISGQTYLTCRFARNKAVQGVSYTIEVANNVNGPWAALDLSQSGIVVSTIDNSPDTGRETITVRDSQPISASACRFMRFRATTK